MAESLTDEVVTLGVELEAVGDSCFCDGSVEVDEEIDPTLHDDFGVVVGEAAIATGCGVRVRIRVFVNGNSKEC